MKVEKLLPEVYYSQSRDFSYIGRLFEIIFNYMKTGADCLAVNPDSTNIDATTIELVALTLGFESKHQYSNSNLIYIINSFSDLIRKKGTKEAINTAIRLLMNSQKIKIDGVTDFVMSESSNESDKFILNISVPERLEDIILLEDLFDYILPAGMLYNINKINQRTAKHLDIDATAETHHAYSINPDTSELLSNVEGGYAYRLESGLDAPGDWGSNYYKYVEGTGFVEKEEADTYTPGTFYKKERNKDIGTIYTGTVFDGGNS